MLDESSVIVTSTITSLSVVFAKLKPIIVALVLVDVSTNVEGVVPIPVITVFLTIYYFKIII